MMHAIRRVVNHGLEHRDLGETDSLHFDEIAIGKGQDYVTMVYQIDSGNKRLLWIGKGRKAKTLLRFFMEFGKLRSASIRYVCCDMWKLYLKVIAKKIQQELNDLDRLNIMEKLDTAIDEQQCKSNYEKILWLPSM